MADAEAAHPREQGAPRWRRHLWLVAGGGLLVGAAIVVLADAVAMLPLGPNGTPYGNGALWVLYLFPLLLVAGEAFCVWQRAWLAALVLPFTMSIGYVLGGTVVAGLLQLVGV